MAGRNQFHHLTNISRQADQFLSSTQIMIGYSTKGVYSIMENKRYLTLACAVLLISGLMASVTAHRVAAKMGPKPPEGETYAIRGGTVVTVTGATISNGVVIIRNGLITDVGADLPIPADARIIEAKGMMVYPGLFDAYTSLGIQAPSATTPASGRTGPPVAVTPQTPTTQSAPPQPSGLAPELSAIDQLRITAETFDTPRSIGITTVLTAPRDGLFQGQSALINLGSDEPEKLILKSPATLNVSFTGSRGGGYPGSLLGVFAYLRQSLLDAQHYREEWARYNRQKRGTPRPNVDKSLAALQPVINGELPVVFWANSVREIKRAVALAEEFNLKYMIAGGLQSYQIADWLKEKNVTVLLSLNYPQPPTNLEDPQSEPLRVLRERAEAPKAAAALSKAGVRFAFQSGHLARAQDFITNAIKAIEAGLPKEEAIKALTIYPAQIFGVAEQLGSIEKGKIANLVITSGDLFDRRTRVKYVFVDGKQYEVSPPPAAAAGGRGSGRRPGAPGTAMATGAWTITVNTPEGPVQGTLNLRQEGDAINGEIGTPFGNFPISGRLSGNEVTFDYTLNIQGQQMPVSARATIEGNSIRGTMNAMGQSFDFSGTRPPGEQ
jgi:imidazolonepropionase-like amidohydrolase